MVSTAEAWNKQRHPRDSLNYIFLRSDRHLGNLAKCWCLICFPVWQCTTLTFEAVLCCAVQFLECWSRIEPQQWKGWKQSITFSDGDLLIYLLRRLELHTHQLLEVKKIIHFLDKTGGGSLSKKPSNLRFLHCDMMVQNHFNHHKWNWLDLDCRLILYQGLFSPVALNQRHVPWTPRVLTLLTEVYWLQDGCEHLGMAMGEGRGLNFCTKAKAHATRFFSNGEHVKAFFT